MKRWFEMKNATGGVVEIYIYDVIGQNWDGSGVSAKQFVEDLAALKDVSTIRLYINSPGGLIHEGMAIYSALVRHSARKEIFIDGMAASIASVVALSGDSVTMGDNALFMIHDPSTVVWGGIEDFQRAIDMLVAAKETILNVYEGKSNLKRDELAAMMKSETWFTAKDAKDAGFITEIAKPVKIAAHWNPSAMKFKNAPANLTDLLGEKKKDEAKAQEPDASAVNDLRRKRLALAEAEAIPCGIAS